MTEKYVIVHRSYDPVQADMIGDILRDNGIFARVLGTRHGAVIGVGQNILQLHIEVPQSQAGQATDFLEAFFETDGAELLREHLGDEAAGDEAAGDKADEAAEDETADPHEPADRSRDGNPRRPLFAAGIALILGIIGGGHLYSRRQWTALVLTAGQLVALWLMLHPEWRDVAVGLALFLTLLASDVIGSQWAVRAHNRGVRTPIARQLLTGALLVAIAGAVSVLAGPHLPQPDVDHDKRARPTVTAPAY